VPGHVAFPFSSLGYVALTGKIWARPWFGSALAWAFVRYSRDYVEEERKAKEDKLGVHLHACQPA
jgi:hypothetical protein